MVDVGIGVYVDAGTIANAEDGSETGTECDADAETAIGANAVIDADVETGAENCIKASARTESAETDTGAGVEAVAEAKSKARETAYLGATCLTAFILPSSGNSVSPLRRNNGVPRSVDQLVSSVIKKKKKSLG